MTASPRSSRQKKPPPGVGKKAAARQSARLGRADRTEPSTPPERQRDPVVTTARKTPAIVTVRDRRLEKFERMARGSRQPKGDSDPEPLHKWRTLLAGKLHLGP